MDNPETLETLSTQDKGRRQNIAHKSKKMGNTDAIKKSGVNLGAREG